MSRDAREQNFDKALARHLGSSSASHADAGNDCLDAEILAAYHERLLDPEEMAQRKSHIASCERCQEVLALLEATDPIRVEADRDLMLDQIVLEQPDSQATPSGPATAPEPHLEIHPEPRLEEAALPMAAASQSESLAASEPVPEFETASNLEIEHEPDLVAASAAPPSLTRSQAGTPAAPASAVPVFAATAKSAPPSSATITFRSTREDRPKIVRFVAIFGAIAAAVVFWLVFREQSNKNFDLAQNHQQKLEMPPQSPAQNPAPTAGDNAATSAPQTSEPNAAASQRAAAPPAAQPQQALSKAPADSASNALDEGKSALDAAKALEQKSKKDAAAQAPAFIPGRDDSVGSSAGAARAGRSTKAASLRNEVNASPVEKALADANAVLHPASNSPSSLPATPPPARTKMNPGVVTETAPAGSGASALSQVSASADALSKPINGRIVSTLTPLSVPAPSGKTIWRIGQAGQIQRSTDSGTTWSIQPSGVVTDLIAGSAYSDQVCWLVGRNGTVLRTINGGATWQKTASPSGVDLLGVFSINADSATVTDAAGRAFETTSAGSHWTRTRLQE